MDKTSKYCSCQKLFDAISRYQNAGLETASFSVESFDADVHRILLGEKVDNGRT